MLEIIMKLTIQVGEAKIVKQVQTRAVVGRDSGCDLCVDDKSVSRRHCVFESKAGLWEVVDLKSANGTWVNGNSCNSSILAIGDCVQIGDIQILIIGIGNRVAAGESTAPKKKIKVMMREPLVGTDVGGYIPKDVLGMGSFGVVYRALQQSLDREVALKVLSQELAQDKDAIASFLQEARFAAALAHPNLVQVYDCGHQGDNVYYSMELIRGGSLEDVLREKGALPWKEALSAILDCLQALDYAEGKGLVHRDVKPANLMIDARGEVKLADLGMAATREIAAKEHGGTPHFMAPECSTKGGVMDSRSDLYSLGCTFFRLVTGRHVFEEIGVPSVLRAHRQDAPPTFSDVGLDTPLAVEAFLQKALQKTPSLRFSSASEMTRAALELEKQAASPLRSTPVVRAPRQSRRRQKKSSPISVIIVLVASALALYWANRLVQDVYDKGVQEGMRPQGVEHSSYSAPQLIEPTEVEPAPDKQPAPKRSPDKSSPPGSVATQQATLKTNKIELPHLSHSQDWLRATRILDSGLRRKSRPEVRKAIVLLGVIEQTYLGRLTETERVLFEKKWTQSNAFLEKEGGSPRLDPAKVEPVQQQPKRVPQLIALKSLEEWRHYKNMLEAPTRQLIFFNRGALNKLAQNEYIQLSTLDEHALKRAILDCEKLLGQY
ncbi:MAG: protein kinase [Planctomycetes bacterium]|jgi:serine/threonine protein kinase|nr:protein kinase [Planctomycetota bacterium]